MTNPKFKIGDLVVFDENQEIIRWFLNESVPGKKFNGQFAEYLGPYEDTFNGYIKLWWPVLQLEDTYQGYYFRKLKPDT